MFDVEIGIDGLGNSHQEPFPESVQCAYCGKLAHSAFTAIEYPGAGGSRVGEEFVCNTRPTNSQGIWPHDCIACTVYICPSCGKATADWNQA